MKNTIKHFFLSACCGGLLAVTGSAGAQQAQAQAQASRADAACARNAYNCVDTANPLPTAKTVWFQEMTWIDVRDALAAGKDTMIVPTGGIEPNGPWLALGKHYYVLRATCEAIAHKLGNALCAPIVDFVPAGYPGAKTGKMASLGAISVRQETYEALITDIAESMRSQGFKRIVLLSDNGGDNQKGMKVVAERLNREWSGQAHAYYIPEYYSSWESADARLLDKGITKKGVRDGIHDDPASTLIMMQTDPGAVRWDERVKAGKATIDGVSIVDKDKSLKLGAELVELRADIAVEAIRKAFDAGKARAAD